MTGLIWVHYSYNHKKEHRLKFLVAITSFVGFLMVVLPGLLYQFFGLDLGTAFTVLRYGVYVGGAALVLILLQILPWFGWHVHVGGRHKWFSR